MSIIPFVEPVSPRYIYINPHTNKVHLMVPVVGGQEISTDNTCKTTVALKNFFDGGAIRELKNYQEKLIFDLLLAHDEEPLKVQKQDRLTQINIYLEAVNAMRFSYGSELLQLLEKPTNLYQIQLRPREQDPVSAVVNPTFSLNRKNDQHGTPLSALYNAMHRIFATTIKIPDPQSILMSAALKTLSASPSFTEIQQALSTQCQTIFSLSIDFTIDSYGNPLKKEELDNLMGFDATTSAQEYIEVLLGSCALHISYVIASPPFYNISPQIPLSERIEKLSILTQFFLAQVNVYCKARAISNKNFGTIFDLSPDLSEQICNLVNDTLMRKEDVETALCEFFNQHATDFSLSQALNADDMEQIKQKFIRNYQTVTATKENPHMDEFMLLEAEAPGDVAKMLTHQGSICINFAEIASRSLPYQDYYAKIRQDFSSLPLKELPHHNNWVANQVNIAPELLATRISEQHLHLLPTEIIKMPVFQTFQFLHLVAQGKREHVIQLLSSSAKQAQNLLRNPGVFTDYSGRAFHCTAYEYAYWAKDTSMCLVLERFMDKDSKKMMRIAIDDMKYIDPITGKPEGLTYYQNGQKNNSVHYDFTPLIDAYKRYIENYDRWVRNKNWGAMSEAWLHLGKVQANVPVHVVYEYCQKSSGFTPRSSFAEAELQQELTFLNVNTGKYNFWYPLPTDNTGLGFDLAIIKGEPGAGGYMIGARKKSMETNLTLIIRLNALRTMEIAQIDELFRKAEPDPVIRRQP